FSTARMSPRLPSWTRSPIGRPVLEKRRAIVTTSPRLASTIRGGAPPPAGGPPAGGGDRFQGGAGGVAGGAAGQLGPGVQAGFVGLGQLDLVLPGEQPMPSDLVEVDPEQVEVLPDTPHGQHPVGV